MCLVFCCSFVIFHPCIVPIYSYNEQIDFTRRIDNATSMVVNFKFAYSSRTFSNKQISWAKHFITSINSIN